MTHVIAPSVWLIFLVLSLPQLSETMYSPSLPTIARDLNVSPSTAENTLTIYLIGFALGILFWGILSDRYGRKLSLLASFSICILGCLSCYFSTSITRLMISLFIQSFGGAGGTVLGQALCRDAFNENMLGKVYSTVASAQAIFLANGPVASSMIMERWGWPAIFLFLIVYALGLSGASAAWLSETHPPENRGRISVLEVARRLLTDSRAVGYLLIVGMCLGIYFSYFAEGPFYLIKLLGLSTKGYGYSFTAMSVATLLGGIVSKKLHDHYGSLHIMKLGLMVIAVASSLFVAVTLLHSFVMPLSASVLIGCTLLSQMGIMGGNCIVINNALALALVDYKWCVGTASSLFGFFYYCVVAGCAFGMATLHNGTLLPMPLYFLSLALLMQGIQRTLLFR